MRPAPGTLSVPAMERESYRAKRGPERLSKRLATCTERSLRVWVEAMVRSVTVDLVARSDRTLGVEGRRLVASWAADCAADARAVFEAVLPDDARVRDAIDQARAFASGELGYRRGDSSARGSCWCGRSGGGDPRQLGPLHTLLSLRLR